MHQCLRYRTEQSSRAQNHGCSTNLNRFDQGFVADTVLLVPRRRVRKTPRHGSFATPAPKPKPKSDPQISEQKICESQLEKIRVGITIRVPIFASELRTVESREISRENPVWKVGKLGILCFRVWRRWDPENRETLSSSLPLRSKITTYEKSLEEYLQSKFLRFVWKQEQDDYALSSNSGFSCFEEAFVWLHGYRSQCPIMLLVKLGSE